MGATQIPTDSPLAVKWPQKKNRKGRGGKAKGPLPLSAARKADKLTPGDIPDAAVPYPKSR